MAGGCPFGRFSRRPSSCESCHAAGRAGRAPLALVPMPLTPGVLGVVRWFKEADHSRTSRPLMERVVLPPGESAPHCAPFLFSPPSYGKHLGSVFLPPNCFCVNCLPMAARPYVARALQSNSFPGLARPLSGSGKNGKDKLL